MNVAGSTDVRWTTDAALRLTSIDGPALADAGLDGSRLVGLPLTLVSCGGASHPVLDAHRTALAGEPVSLEFAWGRWRLTGALVPDRDARGRVIGCTGVAFVRDTYSETERRLAPEWNRLRPRPRRTNLVDAPGRRGLIVRAWLAMALAPLSFLFWAC